MNHTGAAPKRAGIPCATTAYVALGGTIVNPFGAALVWSRFRIAEFRDRLWLDFVR